MTNDEACAAGNAASAAMDRTARKGGRGFTKRLSLQYPVSGDELQLPAGRQAVSGKR
jgi:hypothetical protein